MAQTKTRSTDQRPGSDDRSPPRRGPSRVLLGVLGVVIVAGAGYGIWAYTNRPPDDRLTLSGRLEGYETDIGARVPGRVLQVSVREGDRVRRGQLLVRLDDAELRAQIAGAAASYAAALETARQARSTISIYQSQIEEANLTLEQSRGDAAGRVAQAEATVAQAEAQRAQAQAQVTEARSQLGLARVNRDRYRQLRSEGAIAQQTLDQQQTTLEAAQATLIARQAAVTAADRQVRAAQGALVQTRTAQLNPGIRTAQVGAARGQLAQSRAQLAAAQAQARAARESENQLKAQQAYLTITSPIEGVTIARSVEPGAVVTTGKTLMTLLDYKTVYLRGYIPEGQLGKVRVGQKAQVFLDSDSKRAFAARVSAVDPQASFTPENIYFKDERVRQVFGVKLVLDNPGGYAKPGMPADATILLEEGER